MIRQLALKLWRSERAAAVVELALVAPMLGVMTVGVVDMSNAYSRKLALEQGTQRAIEKIMQTTELSTVETTLKNEVVCQVNGTNTDGSCKTAPITSANVTVTYRLDCMDGGGAITSQTSTNAATFDTYTCATTSKSARYIEVGATDKYAPLFSKVFVGIDSDGTYHISAKAGMRTE